MYINYHLAEIRCPYYVFRIDKEDPISINLSDYYPNYKLPRVELGSENWQFTVIKSDNDSFKLGDIHEFSRDEIRKINTVCKSFTKNGVLFRKTKQTELDEYEYNTFKTTDNAKVYKLILDILIERDKNDNFEEIDLSSPNFKITEV